MSDQRAEKSQAELPQPEFHGEIRLTLDDEATLGFPKAASGIDVRTLHDAITRLTPACPRQARVIELRFFGGLSVDEVALVLGISRHIVENDWAFARSWLGRELES